MHIQFKELTAIKAALPSQEKGTNKAKYTQIQITRCEYHRIVSFINLKLLFLETNQMQRAKC